MKNKALTGIMLIVVAFIWYKVFFRVKDNLFGEENAFADNHLMPNYSSASIKVDTFPLVANYRDPFGETKPKQSTEALEPTEPVPVRTKPIPQAIPWPSIAYYGLIRKTTSKEPLGILSIDGEKYTMRRGEVIFDGIKVIKIDREELIVSYKKETRSYFRN